MSRFHRFLFGSFIVAFAGSTAEANSLPFQITLGGSYAKPFNSSGYSGKQTNGYGIEIQAEWKALNWLALGLGYDHSILLSGAPDTALIDSLDLTGRLTGPWHLMGFQPYVLGAFGYNVFRIAGPNASPRNYHGQAALGLIRDLSPCLSLDLAVAYDAYSPVQSLLSEGGARIGISYGFGSSTDTGTPKPKDLELGQAPGSAGKVDGSSVEEEEINSKAREWAPGRAKGMMSKIDLKFETPLDARNIQCKSWNMEVLGRDGRVLKTLTGNGIVPKTLKLTGLQADEHYQIKMAVTGNDGQPRLFRQELNLPKSTAKSGPMAASAVVVRRGQSLWSMAKNEGVYGDPYLWIAIYEANKDKISDPELIQPGMDLVVPDLNAAERKAAHRRGAAWVSPRRIKSGSIGRVMHTDNA